MSIQIYFGRSVFLSGERVAQINPSPFYFLLFLLNEREPDATSGNRQIRSPSARFDTCCLEPGFQRGQPRLRATP
jgi:hypothetical protein